MGRGHNLGHLIRSGKAKDHKTDVYKVEYFPAPQWGRGNKIKGFGDGKKTKSLKKEKKIS